MRYIPRLIDSALSELLATFPAALLLGPRACGKTTSARRAASEVIELDDPRQAAPFRADPSAALQGRLRSRGRKPGPVLLDVDAGAVMADGVLLGRMLETFVMAQLRPLLGIAKLGVHAYHVRQQDGRREIDVILEAADGRVVGVEIKATASPSAADARHLAWLRDQLGDRFVAGVVLSTVNPIYPLGGRLAAVPIAALWVHRPLCQRQVCQ